VNYILVGGAVLSMASTSDASSGTASARLAQGSYACLYLVNALSVLVASTKTAGELAGLVTRVEELLQALDAHPAASDASNDTGKRSVRPTPFYTQYLDLLRLLGGGDASSSDGEGECAALEMGGTMSAFSYSLLPAVAATEDSADSKHDHSGLQVTYTDRHEQLLAPALAGPDSLLTVSGLDVFAGDETVTFAEGGVAPVRLIRGLRLEVRRGVRLLVTGPSGCGKSTLVRRIAEAVRLHHEGVGAAPAAQQVVLGVPLSRFVICPQAPFLFKVTHWSGLYAVYFIVI
jgi:ABC-type uncharacterized transport system fused permease/ATPase subunit